MASINTTATQTNLSATATCKAGQVATPAAAPALQATPASPAAWTWPATGLQTIQHQPRHHHQRSCIAPNARQAKRDLREAMSLGTADATSLQTKVAAFAAATTRDAQMAEVDGILTDWAKTSGQLLSSTYKYNLNASGSLLVTGNLVDESPGSWVLTLHPDGMEESNPGPGGNQILTPTPTGVAALKQLNLLEVFNGAKLLQMNAPAPQANTGATAGGSGGTGGGAAGPNRVDGYLSPSQMDFLNQSYASLKDSVYGALALQTRLKPYLDSINLVIDTNGVSFSTTALAAKLDAAKAANPASELADLADLNRLAQGTLQAVGFDGIGRLRAEVAALPVGSSTLAALRVTTSGATGSFLGDIYLGDADGTTFNSGDGTDVLDGGAGDDTLGGEAGDDFLYGGAGNDNLYGGDGGDLLKGDAGDDQMYGQGGNDTLDGGVGNDYLDAGLGNDMYLFGKGDGQDDIGVDVDTTAGRLNVLQFKSGVLASEIGLIRTAGSLVLSITGTSDSVNVHNFFDDDGSGNSSNPIQQIRFADGTGWDIATIKALTLLGNDSDQSLNGYRSADTINAAGGSDTVFGFEGDDTLEGGLGNDYLDGGDGADIVRGGADNDQLYGQGGNDTLDGGAGNDYLDAGLGDDTFLFGKGDGQDDIGLDWDTTAGRLNVLQLKAGVAVGEVVLTRLGGALILSIAGTNDSVNA
ncbi:MAG: hypothetical protein IPJ18_18575 [Betaproteobacteria bacterium]|nr:hypothetical protein [Betaproteobacteria bacterium]